MNAPFAIPRNEEDIRVDAGEVELTGDLKIPANASGCVIFAHGSGSGRKSSRNRFVADVLRRHGIGTFLFDLLTLDEERQDAFTGHLRFDIALLADRLARVTAWYLSRQGGGPVGYFGASTGAAAALIAAAQQPDRVQAVVSRGGRPDLAGPELGRVQAPTLLIVGGADGPVVGMNENAYRQLRCKKQIEIIPGASHLFPEPGALERVAELAAEWFERFFRETDAR